MMPKHTSQWAKHRLGFKREYQGGWKKALQEWKYSIHVKCFPFSNFSSYLVHCHLNLFLFINSSSNHFGLCLWWFLVACCYCCPYYFMKKSTSSGLYYTYLLCHSDLPAIHLILKLYKFRSNVKKMFNY